MNEPRALGVEDDTAISQMLAETDALLRRCYPGESGRRNPVHTVYLPADRYHRDLPQQWGRDALASVEEHGGMAHLCSLLGIDNQDIAAKVVEKLHTEPIEDLRIDCEDGYGDRPDETEDADVRAAARAVSAAYCAGEAPPFIGIRFKSLEESSRARGIRTLDLFLAELQANGPLPAGLMLTLPKVSTPAQVAAMVSLCHRLETAHGLEPGLLRFEVQVETPQLILGTEGTVPVAQILHSAENRVTSLHYGTYDYSASLGIAAGYQSMEHPVADYAKAVMQVAAAGTGVTLSDGSTNILPVGEPEQVIAAWKLHFRLVTRSLERGYYQGWDLHPAQLPTRFLANYQFYCSGFPGASSRLRAYLNRAGGSGFLDEPATAKALAGFIYRGVLCGAITTDDVLQHIGLDAQQLSTLAHPRLSHKHEPE